MIRGIRLCCRKTPVGFLVKVGILVYARVMNPYTLKGCLENLPTTLTLDLPFLG